MGKAVFCLAGSEFQAEAMVNELKVAGFAEREISVLLPDKGAQREAAPNSADASPEESARVLGRGALGWLAGIASLTVPGAGSFIAAGPVMAALQGAASAGISVTLQGMGIPEPQARNYERKISEGAILVSVFSDTGEEASRALAIFEQAGGLEIVSTAELQISPPDVRQEKWEQW